MVYNNLVVDYINLVVYYIIKVKKTYNGGKFQNMVFKIY